MDVFSFTELELINTPVVEPVHAQTEMCWSGVRRINCLQILVRYKNCGQTKTLNPTCCFADSVCSYINDYRLKVSSLSCKPAASGETHPSTSITADGVQGRWGAGGWIHHHTGPTRGPTPPQCSHTEPLTFWCVPEDRCRRARSDCRGVNLQVQSVMMSEQFVFMFLHFRAFYRTLLFTGCVSVQGLRPLKDSSSEGLGL